MTTISKSRTKKSLSWTPSLSPMRRLTKTLRMKIRRSTRKMKMLTRRTRRMMRTMRRRLRSWKMLRTRTRRMEMLRTPHPMTTMLNSCSKKKSIKVTTWTLSTSISRKKIWTSILKLTKIFKSMTRRMKRMKKSTRSSAILNTLLWSQKIKPIAKLRIMN